MEVVNNDTLYLYTHVVIIASTTIIIIIIMLLYIVVCTHMYARVYIYGINCLETVTYMYIGVQGTYVN